MSREKRESLVCLSFCCGMSSVRNQPCLSCRKYLGAGAAASPPTPLSPVVPRQQRAEFPTTKHLHTCLPPAQLLLLLAQSPPAGASRPSLEELWYAFQVMPLPLSHQCAGNGVVKGELKIGM